MFKSMIVSSLLICSYLSLIGCETNPYVFGVPQNQWNQLTKEQQDEVIRGYNEQQHLKQQNAPFMTAIDTAGRIIKNNPN